MRIVRCIHGGLLALMIVAVPIYYWRHCQANARNFRIVRPGVLYRSGQMTLTGLKRAIHDFGIKTVITLRDTNREDDEPPDLVEEQYCKKQEMTHVRITPRHWEAPDGSVPAEEGVRRFFEIMDNPDTHPVLVHCLAGMHRTGAYCAIYRMEYDRWPNQRAIDEVKACGYVNLDREDDVRGYLENYQARWRDAGGRSSWVIAKKAASGTPKKKPRKGKKHVE